MPDADFFGKVAGLLNLAAFVPYILAIFGWSLRFDIRLLQRIAEPTRPNRATWFIWAIVGAVILPAYSASGANETAWVPAALIVGPFVVAVLSIWWGEGGWSRTDKVCLTGACVSALMWAATGSPVVGLLLGLAADGFGVAATVRHAYHHPEQENRLAWMLFLVGDIANLFAVTDWSWSAFPIWFLTIYMVGHTLPIVAMLYRHNKK